MTGHVVRVVGSGQRVLNTSLVEPLLYVCFSPPPPTEQRKCGGLELHAMTFCAAQPQPGQTEEEKKQEKEKRKKDMHNDQSGGRTIERRKKKEEES
jgi:hypothetical protein